MSTERVTLTVHGMHCQSCAQRLQRALAKVKGVSAVQVNLEAEQVVVDRVPGQAATEQLVQAVRQTGFEVPE